MAAHTPRPAGPAAAPGHAGGAAQLRPAGILGRYISCQVLALLAGLAWKLTLAPSRIGVTSALLGVLVLLSGFVVGGLGWYFRDATLRTRHPERVPDERLVFSFVVFALMPFAVGLLVLVVYVIALLVGFS